MEEKYSEKHQEARNSLPDELKPLFDDLVADYKFAATIRYGRPYISYAILADLIKSGWRSQRPLR